MTDLNCHESSWQTLEGRTRSLAVALGLCGENQEMQVTPLSGGVASDIAVVDLGSRRICMKFALPKLKVEADWYAPVNRNRAEYAWLTAVAARWPDNAPKLEGRSEELSGFAMEFIEGDDVFLWKTELLQETPESGEAAKVGRLLGEIHVASTAEDFDASLFHNSEDFWSLRLEPYLIHTALQHPTISSELTALADALHTASQVLVHGDVSPKNILLRKTGPVILDAECATMGDASFDPAFCLNHLMLKAVHLPKSRGSLLCAIEAFWNAYAEQVTWERPDAVEARVCRLLPCLLMARIDGKSPVEYLDSRERNQVRQLALELIQQSFVRLLDIVNFTNEKLRQPRS